MPPKKKGKEKKEEPKPALGPPPKPKKIPPPPACFSPEDIARFKEMFKEHDEEGIDKVIYILTALMINYSLKKDIVKRKRSWRNKLAIYNNKFL